MLTMKDWRAEAARLLKSNPPGSYSLKSLIEAVGLPPNAEGRIRRYLRDNPQLKAKLVHHNDMIVVGSTLKGAKPMTLKQDEVKQLVDAEKKALKLKETSTVATRKYQHLLKEHNKLQREFDGVTKHLDRDIRPQAIKPTGKKARNEAVPLLVLSDWHVEEEVKPHTVGGKNKYTLDIARKRSERVFQTFVKLVKEKEDDMDIKHIAVFLLGDFITGNIHDENVENAQLLPLDALAYAQELLEAGLDFLLEQTDKDLHIYCKVGNHSRITRRVHASTEWENSLELAMYWSMNRKYHNNPRVTFHMEKSYLSIVDILGTKVRFHHGHAVNYGGGVGGLHIPLRKAIHNWNANEKADVDIMGHYHGFLENSTLKYMVNGSLIGYSAYAERIKAVAERPIQGFGLIHARYGFTSLNPIYAE